VALSFAAANREAIVSNDSSIEGLTAFTFMGWIKTNATAKDDGIFYRVNASDGSVYRLIFDDTSGNMQFATWRASGIGFRTTNDAPVSNDVWTCVAGTFDATNGAEVYTGTLDSPMVESSYGTESPESGVLDTNDGDLILGNHIATKSTRFLDGSMAKFKHFDTRLTVEELILQQYLNVPSAALKIDMELGTSGTTTQEDLSGFGNTAAITGATKSDHVPLVRRRTMSFVPVSQTVILAVNDITSATALTQPALVQHNVLAADDILTSTLVTQPALVQHNVIAVNDIDSATLVGAAGLTQHNILAVNAVLIDTTISEVTFTAAASLAVDGVAVGTVITQATLDTAIALLVDNLLVSSEVTAPVLAQHSILAVDDIDIDTLISVVDLGGVVIACLEGEIVIAAQFDGKVTIEPVFDGSTAIEPAFDGNATIN